jgi:hypothetical protein
MGTPVTTKRVSLYAQSEGEQDLVSALNELNLAIRMLDQHVLTGEQRNTMQHLHLSRVQIIAARVLDNYEF